MMILIIIIKHFLVHISRRIQTKCFIPTIQRSPRYTISTVMNNSAIVTPWSKLYNAHYNGWMTQWRLNIHSLGRNTWRQDDRHHHFQQTCSNVINDFRSILTLLKGLLWLPPTPEKLLNCWMLLHVHQLPMGLMAVLRLNHTANVPQKPQNEAL